MLRLVTLRQKWESLGMFLPRAFLDWAEIHAIPQVFSEGVHQGNLSFWKNRRVARENTGICREIRNGRIRPGFVGIWNPTRRFVWMQRLDRAGYRLEMIYERMEFYVSAETRRQIAEDRWRK